MKSFFRSNSKRNGNIFALIFDFFLNSNSNFQILRLFFNFCLQNLVFGIFRENRIFRVIFLHFFSDIFLVDLACGGQFFFTFFLPPFLPPIPPCFSLFFSFYFSYFLPLHRAARARARDVRGEARIFKL